MSIRTKNALVARALATLSSLAPVPALVAALSVALSASASAGDLAVRDAWIRLPPPGANAAGYMVIENEGASVRRIVGVACDVAARAELHRSWVEDGVAHMRRVDAIEVPAGGELRLEPRGLHVMLIRPSSLVEGQRVALRFEVEGGGELAVEVEVRRSAPGAPAQEPPPPHAH